MTDYNSLAGGVHGFSRYEFGFLFYLSQLCRGQGCGGLFLLFVVESLDVSVNVAALLAVLSLKCSILSCLGQFGWGLEGGGLSEKWGAGGAVGGVVGWGGGEVGCGGSGGLGVCEEDCDSPSIDC